MDMTLETLTGLEPGSYTLVDLRSAHDIGYGKIPGALEIPAGELEQKLPRDGKPVVLYCAWGRLSQEPAENLRDAGFDAYSLKGGYMGWLKAEMAKQDDSLCAQVEESIRKRFRKKIWCNFTKAIREYELVRPGDVIGVCISGGKDSMLMAKLFQELKIHNKFPFEVKFLVMDPGYSPENRRVIEENARKLHVPVKIFESDIFDSVYNVSHSPCYLCARMRRGYLYSFAKSLGCNKIALGHHYDDVIETILMGMLYGSQIQTMMPKLHSTNFPGMELIRPMYLIREADIKTWRDVNGLHFIQCACKFTDSCTTCGNEENRSKRAEIKQLIQTLKVKNPEVEAHIFRSVENVNVDTVIAYKKHGKKISFLEEYDHAEPAEGNGSPLPASGGIAGKPGLPGNELAKHCGNLPAAGIEKS